MSGLERDPLNLIITGVGGQGNVLISRLIGEALVNAGYKVTVGETYGASQRGGAVASHVRISRDTELSAITSVGRADIILGLEPMETLRILCSYGNPKAFVITNTRPIHTMAVTTGEAEYPRLSNMKQIINELCQRAWYIDASQIAIGLGAPVVANMVILGALIGTRLLPLSKKEIEQQLRVSLREESLSLDLRAFAVGYLETVNRKTPA